MEYKHEAWIARDKDGYLCMCLDKPKRDGDVWRADWCYGICANLFYDLEWENEPIKAELRSVVTDIEAKAKKYANSITNKKELQEIIVNAFKAGYKA